MPLRGGKVLSRLLFTVTIALSGVNGKEERTHHLHEILSGVNLRVEIIISLLAVLELLKRNVIVAWQDQLFGEIVIEKAPPLSPEVLEAPPPSADDSSDEW